MKKITTICMVLSMFFVFTAFSSALAASGSIAIPYFKYDKIVSGPNDVVISTNESAITNTDSASIEIWIKAYAADGTLIGELPPSTEPGLPINGNGAMLLDFTAYCKLLGVESASFVIDWTGSVTSTPMVSLLPVAADARELVVTADMIILK